VYLISGGVVDVIGKELRNTDISRMTTNCEEFVGQLVLRIYLIGNLCIGCLKGEAVVRQQKNSPKSTPWMDLIDQ